MELFIEFIYKHDNIKVWGKGAINMSFGIFQVVVLLKIFLPSHVPMKKMGH